MALTRERLSTFSQMLTAICMTVLLFVGQVHSQTSPKTETTFDTCRNGRQYNISVDCKRDTEPLADTFPQIPLDQQCRSFCRNFNNTDFTLAQMPSECNYCKNNETIKFQKWITNIEKKLNIHVCVPRGICINSCGPEPPGCVYSGTCASFICLKSKSGEPAKRRRVTHTGPRSIFEADGRTAATETASRLGSVTIQSVCKKGDQDILFPTTDNECLGRSGEKPLSDAQMQNSTGQCRSFCIQFSAPKYEVLHAQIICSLCKRLEASDYIFLKGSTRHICIPRETCQAKCGKEPPGCVYSGTCNDYFCFSGINSKRAANISGDDSGDPSSLTVNDEGPPTAIDPPLYADLSNVEPDPDAIGIGPKPSPEDSEEQSSDAEKGNEDDDKSATRWVWLGAVLGLVGAVVVAIGGIYAAFVLKGKGDKPKMETDALDEPSE